MFNPSTDKLSYFTWLLGLRSGHLSSWDLLWRLCRIYSGRNRPLKLFESGDAEYRMKSLAVNDGRVVFL
jgi:hypothetical protein